MVNLYDSPAQAQFINTYVPIQFDGLYKMADKAQKDMDTGTALLDKLSENQSLGSLSAVDNATWKSQVSDPIQKVVDENVKSNYDLTNPTVLGKLSSLTRRIAGSPLAKTLINSRDSLKQAATKVDPQWGDTYADKFKSYDSSKSGEYTGSPMDYVGWEKTGDQFTSDITPRYVGTKGGYRVMKIDPNDINQVVNEKSNEISSNPQVNMLIDKDVQEGRVDMSKYSTIDPTTKQPVVNPNWKTLYAKDMIAKTKMDATKGAKYEYDQAAADARRDTETRLYHAQTLAQKQQVIEKNNIVENYLTDKIIGASADKGNDFRNVVTSRLAGIKDPNERFNRASQIFGPGAASFMMSSMKNDDNSRQLQNLQSQRAAAQAAGAPTNNIDKSISALNASISKNNNDMNNSMPAFNAVVQREENLARAGKSNVWSKEHIASLNTVEMPYQVSNAYSEANYGKKIQVLPTAGGSLEGFTGPVSRLKLRTNHGSDDRGDILNEMTSRIKDPNFRRQMAPVLSGFISNVASGKYENRGFSVPSGSAVIDGNKANAKSVYYVPEEVLTPNEAMILKKLYGSQEIVTKDNTYDAENAIQTSVKKKYIPIPSYMSSVDLNNPTSNTIANSILAHDANVKFGKTNASTSYSNIQSEEE